jgi:hypothetical protein
LYELLTGHPDRTPQQLVFLQPERD